MKKIIFFCGVWNCLLFNVSGSEIGSELSNLNPFHEVYEEHSSEFYTRRSLNATDNNENSLMELLLDYANLLVEIEKEELEGDIKLWFESQLDTLLYLQDPIDYEIYKKSLREDLEWYEVIYSDLPVLNLIKDWINGL